MDSNRTSLHERLELFVQLLMSRVHAQGLDQLVDLDLSLSQARTLFAVAQQARPLPIAEVAAAIGLSPAAAGRTVDSLVRLGALERRESSDDRRVKLVQVTPRGFDFVDAQFEHKRRALRDVADRLSPSDAERLDEVLGHILAGDALAVPHHQEEQS
ncbi:hypothetical protein GCM10009821_26730 [Aeromicrobium halocynthiae]|uniref:HTH marR-type domain-containing protein n=1 Tax=Aeromicrobium halocynthiae TaxID=560557 RepID=A0ABN2W5T2_9ACTN